MQNETYQLTIKVCKADKPVMPCYAFRGHIYFMIHNLVE